METDTEEVSQTSSTNMQQALNRDHNSQFMRYLIDNEDFLTGIRRQLRGEIYNYEKNCYEQQEGRAKLNDTGVSWVMTELRTMTDRMFQTSNFTSAEIERDIESFEHDLIDHLFAHAKEYDLNITADTRVIFHLVSHAVYATRKKSQNAGFFKGIGSSTQHTEVISDRSQGKQSIINKVKGSINI